MAKKILQNCLFLQSRQQTAVHLVASRQTGTATAILRALLAAAGKDIRLKPDGVSEHKQIKIYLIKYLST